VRAALDVSGLRLRPARGQHFLVSRHVLERIIAAAESGPDDLILEIKASFGTTIVVVSHDLWFLDRLATHILAFEGDGYVHWCEGNFQTYEEQRKERMGESADEPKRFRYKKLQHG